MNQQAFAYLEYNSTTKLHAFLGNHNNKIRRNVFSRSEPSYHTVIYAKKRPTLDREPHIIQVEDSCPSRFYTSKYEYSYTMVCFFFKTYEQDRNEPIFGGEQSWSLHPQETVTSIKTVTRIKIKKTAERPSSSLTPLPHRRSPVMECRSPCPHCAPTPIPPRPPDFYY